MRLAARRRDTNMKIRSEGKILTRGSSVILLLICLLSGPQASAQGGGSSTGCLTWSSTVVPFDSVYYVSDANADGDRLVAGDMSPSTYAALRSQIPAPGFVDQQFCGSVQLAPRIYAQAYVPTPSEWAGDFSSSSQGLLLDPFTAGPQSPANGYPFPGGIIPSGRIPITFAWRIHSYSSRPPIASTGPLRFIPVSPCRVADTREATGSFGAPRLAGEATREFSIPAAPCGIPSSAQAYSLNFTVIPQSKLDYLTVFPTGTSRPLASLLNSYDGRIKANAAIVPAGADGEISVFATDTTHVIIDVDGYFVPDSDTTALAFFPLPPCRVMDTREAVGVFGAPAWWLGRNVGFPSCRVTAVCRRKLGLTRSITRLFPTDLWAI